ncbi:hypothetical protein IFM61606_02670 [Aspergillus udagawae]|uniref:Uncharacterized protein n=1 Tax=Aspergillus udagawae TaxID=91492 RepID=A0ABQ1ARD6_9EURO|nr:hypothetical protein IFM51744_06387 [Aspergillus udagawae]GFF86698.1 hypothetical protein IFM53868_04896 [Aspergillus udagawae]GFG07575.1 hypothetical protein IFM5058_03489 [Aspergillus udagawae]GFG22803.1 hypothetical protein IFM61606_02670 [Aspergillus udagawae]
MRLAIARFRSRMAAANQKFLQDRINGIEAKGLATEEEKRRRLRKYRWMNYLEWDDDDPETRGKRGGRIRIPQETSVADLDIPTILNALPSPEPVDGVLPPLLRTEQWRQMYLNTVQRVCQGQADAIVPEDEVELDVACNSHKDHRPMTIPRCDELALFLKYAQGVVDIDFWLSGIAPFTPAWSAGVKDEELDRLNEAQRCDKLADLELLKCEQEGLQQTLEDEVFDGCLEAFVDEDLEYDDEDDDIQDAANIRDWGWRVVVFQAEINNPSILYGRKARFDSIPEFLDWYASWLDHLDAQGLLSLRRHAEGCETDCESDCEDHC